jgi:hypothetical protein
MTNKILVCVAVRFKSEDKFNCRCLGIITTLNVCAK